MSASVPMPAFVGRECCCCESKNSVSTAIAYWRRGQRALGGVLCPFTIGVNTRSKKAVESGGPSGSVGASGSGVAAFGYKGGWLSNGGARGAKEAGAPGGTRSVAPKAEATEAAAAEPLAPAPLPATALASEPPPAALLPAAAAAPVAWARSPSILSERIVAATQSVIVAVGLVASAADAEGVDGDEGCCCAGEESCATDELKLVPPMLALLPTLLVVLGRSAPLEAGEGLPSAGALTTACLMSSWRAYAACTRSNMRASVGSSSCSAIDLLKTSRITSAQCVRASRNWSRHALSIDERTMVCRSMRSWPTRPA